MVSTSTCKRRQSLGGMIWRPSAATAAAVTALLFVTLSFSVDLVSAAQHDAHHFLRTDNDDRDGEAEVRHQTRRRIAGDVPPAVGDATTTLAIACRGPDCQSAAGDNGGDGSPGSQGVATTADFTADFFGGGDGMQTNPLHDVLPSSASGEDSGELGGQQTAEEVSDVFFAESVADLVDHLEAKKKANDEDRLCNTEEEQVRVVCFLVS